MVTRNTSFSDAVAIRAYIGSQKFTQNQSLTLHFDILLNPLKPIESDSDHWDYRYVQVPDWANATELALQGVTVVNLHQVNNFQSHTNLILKQMRGNNH